MTVKVEKKGPGWWEVKGADLSGHQIIKAETGEMVGSLGHTQSSMKLPSGIYNVTVGQAVWKSVEVKAGEKTVLAPGFLKVVHPPHRETRWSILKPGPSMARLAPLKTKRPSCPAIMRFSLKEGEELKFQ